ncbi:hypothetical protein ACGFY7_26990 [Streptomyces prunicolor]|uniref:WD40 repeat domain-containing protein n=1 Tax=Streptomyces prunicolor TaxID=67348 RepID=UPI003714EEA1
MGRPEIPVDPDAGPVQRLAYELRELRRAAGGPSYRSMAGAAGCTAATLSRAAGGERLPSLAVLQGYVRACGGDPAEWESRWEEAEAEVARAPRDGDADEVPPYRGLARFEPGDRELFFGRDRLIDELGELVCAHRFAVMFGASGSGKSSLLRAGLIPRLQEEIARRGRPAALRVFTPGARPVETYGHLLAPAEGDPESYVIVDQFEEVFTLCRDAAERARFIDLLLTAREPDSRLKVLVAVRADFYPRCAEHRELARALCGAGMLVGPMSAEELRDVVVKPAQAAGLIVERELTARIVEEVLGEPGGLPMLSHALLETWRRRRSRMLSLAAYEGAGGVRGAIAATAEEAYGRLSETEARAARRVLLRMVEPGQCTSGVRRLLDRADVGDRVGLSAGVVDAGRSPAEAELGGGVGSLAGPSGPGRSPSRPGADGGVRLSAGVADAGCSSAGAELDGGVGSLASAPGLRRSPSCAEPDGGAAPSPATSDTRRPSVRAGVDGWVGPSGGVSDAGRSLSGVELDGGVDPLACAPDSRRSSSRAGLDGQAAPSPTASDTRRPTARAGADGGVGLSAGVADAGRSPAGAELDGGVDLLASAQESRRSPSRAEPVPWATPSPATPSPATPDTRRPLTRTELANWADPSVPLVLDVLTRARLLTRDEDGVHLAHEALITCWPRLREWVEEDRERLREHRRLAEAARVWLEHGRDPGALYRGAGLRRAEELFPACADDPALTTPERAFLIAAFEARDAELRAGARAVRRGRTLMSMLSAVLVVALVAGVVAWQQHRDSRRKSTDDTARRVAEVADSLRTTDPRTAQLLGLAAWRTAQLPETRRALLGALAQPETDSFTDPDPDPESESESESGDSPGRFLVDSGRTLLSVDGRTWRTWNVVTRRRRASGRLPDGRVVSASPDGRLLAVYSESAPNTIRLWDTVDGQWTGLTSGAAVGAVDLAADAHSYLESYTDDDQVRLRSAVDGRVLLAARVPDSADVAVSSDGRLGVVCPTGHAPQVWDLAHRGTLNGAWEKAGALCHDGDSSLVVVGGGRRFAVVTADGVHVWDTATGRQVAGFAAPDVDSAVFSADGAFLATVDNAEIKVWRLSDTGAPVLRYALNNQVPAPGGLAWDPDHPRLRYLEAGTVHTLDIATAVTSAWTDQPLDQVLLSPDGRTLATAQRTGATYRVRLRDTATGRVTRTLPAPPAPVSTDPTEPVDPSGTLPLLAFSPDGRTLAYGVSAPGRNTTAQPVTLWGISDGHVRTTLDLATPSSHDAVVNLALGPNSRTLYAVRAPVLGDLRVEAWDTGRHRRTGSFPTPGAHLAVRPDGRLLVGDDRAVRLSSGSGTADASDLAEGGEIGALAFAPDGSRLAVGDDSGRVTLWDGSGRHRAGILRNVFPAPLGDHPESVSALALSPDGRTLAVGGDTGTLQLWDIATGQPLGDPLPTPGDPVDSLAFSADSTTLYASGLHVPLQRYVVDPARAVPLLCARTGDAELTRAQWHTYLPDVPYRTVCGGG